MKVNHERISEPFDGFLNEADSNWHFEVLKLEKNTILRHERAAYQHFSFKQISIVELSGIKIRLIKSIKEILVCTLGMLRCIANGFTRIARKLQAMKIISCGRNLEKTHGEGEREKEMIIDENSRECCNKFHKHRAYGQQHDKPE